ncbi:MAG TPA: Holliday junction resolvase [Candidatus Thermoplasmatota archaeon]|nr:Holliday junction resolvase [Candidatus Thermoplasmatota archaeon]
MSSAYERELKGILGGDADVIGKAARTFPTSEQTGYRAAVERPFLVVRGAGSLGVDLVALRGDVSFPIEVKSASRDVIHFSDASGANHAQAEAMRKECARASVIPLYAYRLKGVRGGDPWRVFTLPTEGLPPRLSVLYDRLPKVAVSPGGFYVLRWSEGLSLSRFLDYLCR